MYSIKGQLSLNNSQKEIIFKLLQRCCDVACGTEDENTKIHNLCIVFENIRQWRDCFEVHENFCNWFNKFNILIPKMKESFNQVSKNIELFIYQISKTLSEEFEKAITLKSLAFEHAPTVSGPFQVSGVQEIMELYQNSINNL